MPDALRRVVSRMLLSPEDTVAVAGSVMVRNSRESLIAAAQTWDYFLGIGSIKREQALLQGTLVAQGAFSVYDTEALQTSGGWPDCIGEDIVMTWALLARGGPHELRADGDRLHGGAGDAADVRAPAPPLGARA